MNKKVLVLFESKIIDTRLNYSEVLLINPFAYQKLNSSLKKLNNIKLYKTVFQSIQFTRKQEKECAKFTKELLPKINDQLNKVLNTNYSQKFWNFELNKQFK